MSLSSTQDNRSIEARFLAEAKEFLYSETFIPALGPTQPPV